MDWNVIKSLYQSNIEQVFESTVYWYFVAFFVFLILCFWIMRKLRRELVPVFKDDEGDVQLTPHALEELVIKTCQKESRKQPTSRETQTQHHFPNNRDMLHRG